MLLMSVGMMKVRTGVNEIYEENMRRAMAPMIRGINAEKEKGSDSNIEPPIGCEDANDYFNMIIFRVDVNDPASSL